MPGPVHCPPPLPSLLLPWSHPGVTLNSWKMTLGVNGNRNPYLSSLPAIHPHPEESRIGIWDRVKCYTFNTGMTIQLWWFLVPYFCGDVQDWVMVAPMVLLMESQTKHCCSKGPWRPKEGLEECTLRSLVPSNESYCVEMRSGVFLEELQWEDYTYKDCPLI